jgi:outer membrane cobalamin receptor
MACFFLLNFPALAQDNQESDSLQVKEKNFEEKAFELFTCEERISSEDIDNSIVKTLGDVLKRYRVVDVTSYGIYGQPEIPNIWSGTSELTPFYLDFVPLTGQSLNFPQTGDRDLNTFPFKNIERIEILDGPVSNVLGKDAGLGCLNLVAKDYKGTEPYSRATFQRGPDHYRHTMVELGRDLLPMGRFYLTGDFRKYGGKVPRSSLDSKYLTGKFSFELNPYWEMSFYALHYNTETEIPQSSDVLLNAEKKEESDWILNLRSWHQMKGNASLTFDFFYSPQNQKLKGEDTFFPHEKKEKNFSLKASFEKRISSHHLILKSFLRKQSFDENENPHHSLWDGSFSVADMFGFSEKFSFLLFLKGDKFEGFDPGFSTMGGISYCPNMILNFFSTLGMNNSYPSLHDLYLDLSYHGVKTSIWEYGRNYLREKKILSANWGAKLKKDKFKITFTTIYSKIEDNILWMEERPQIRDTDILGFHHSFKLTPHPYFEVYLSYAYKKSQCEESDYKFVLPFIPQHSLFCFAQFKNERLRGGLGATVRLEGEFLSARYLDYNEKNKDPEVLLLDSKFDLRFLDFHFYYVIENITDQEYRTRKEFEMAGQTHWWGFYWEFFD